MNYDLNQARSVLQRGGITCVLCRDHSIRTSSVRGVAPLLDFLKEGTWSGYSAADKVVGKATAYLYILMDVRAVYAPVMTKDAIRLLENHSISCHYDLQTDAVLNRSHTGLCPMESAVLNIDDPQQALNAITSTLTLMSQKSHTFKSQP